MILPNLALTTISSREILHDNSHSDPRMSSEPIVAFDPTEHLDNNQLVALNELRHRIFNSSADADSNITIDTTNTPRQRSFSLSRKKETIPTSSPTLAHDEILEFCTDVCLVRYLRARQWNVDKAEKMLRETIKWRAEFRPDCITAEEIRVELENEGKMYVFGKDKSHRPVIVMRPGLYEVFSS